MQLFQNNENSLRGINQSKSFIGIVQHNFSLFCIVYFRVDFFNVETMSTKKDKGC